MAHEAVPAVGARFGGVAAMVRHWHAIERTTGPGLLAQAPRFSRIRSHVGPVVSGRLCVVTVTTGRRCRLPLGVPSPVVAP